MRSSKSRSRSKSNRQRSMGNIINRVFDSSGPEGKVRGTPQQIIDKYQGLARDAQLGNDRVAEQSFFQYAEHYTRMLGEATREMAREQEQRQAQQGNQGGQGSDAGGNGGNNQQGSQQGGQQGGGSQGGQHGQGGRDGRQDDNRRSDDNRRATGSADVIEVRDEDGSGLVETPETRPAPQSGVQPDAQPDTPKAPRPRAPRGPRRPRGGGPTDPSGEVKSPAAE